MAQQWQFIPTSSIGKPNDEKTRKRIRENAMRHFRQSERQARVREHVHRNSGRAAGTLPTWAITTSQEQQGLIGEGTELESCMDGKAKAQVVNPRGPGSAFDPFSSTALPNHPDAPRLFHHFVRTIAPQLQPGNVADTNNPFNGLLAREALSDTGAISSILFHAGVHDELRKGQKWSRATSHFFGCSVRLLNDKLGLEEEAVSDEAICMVGFLCASGNITGDVADDETHWNALQTMLEMRGGIGTLGWKGGLALILQSGSLIHATVSSTRPRLPPPDVSTNPLVASLPSLPSFHPPTVTYDESYITEIDNLMAAYRQLASVQITLFGNPNISIDTVLSFNQLCLALEHANLDLPSPVHSPSPRLLLYKAVHLTLMICTSVIFRNFLAQSASFVSIQSRLKPTLVSLEIALQDADFALDRQEWEMLLWILWVGGMMALDREWYSPRIERVASQLGVHGWVEARAVFEKFVWVPKLEERNCADFKERLGWSEVNIVM